MARLWADLFAIVQHVDELTDFPRTRFGLLDVLYPENTTSINSAEPEMLAISRMIIDYGPLTEWSMPSFHVATRVNKPVSCDSFDKRAVNVIAVEAPNVVGIITRHNDGLAQLRTRAVPFDEHNRPFISNPLNLIDMAIDHGGYLNVRKG